MTTPAIALPPAVAKFPILGWMVDDAVTGHDDAKYYFIGNVVLTLVLAVALVGYPLLIVLALAAAALAMTTIVILTAADMIENRRPRRTAARPSRKGR
jgi:hypothetical protein